MMRILVACEFSQVVCKAFRARGHEAYSCDLLPTEGNPEWHIQDDVLKHLDDGWDMMIAHPPCTYLANSGVRWLKGNNKRWQLMVESCEFFNELLDAPISKIAIENPVIHGHARIYLKHSYNQIIQPWQFGHPETKATCLWLKGLPHLTPTKHVDGRSGRVWREPPNVDRWKNRSRTYQGIADAMAEQWG